ncbi:MAG: hypothetical protein J0I49_20045 [Pseudonocardia sp.]|uniref:hypothetical protein n=1 Tax=Pseudonocardia sp. TaxID=60912 RepID=UPI001AC95227|nr:hypothetical protein [Pseudonocardia sp.]MBN9100382.1 hypothetical protein [Pseudonocardia sp.]
MPTGRLAPAQHLLTEALDTLDHAAGPAAGDTEMLSVLTVCEGATRRLDLIAVHTVAALQRRGVFADRGYKNPIGAVADLLGCEWADARRRSSARCRSASGRRSLRMPYQSQIASSTSSRICGANA